MNRLLGALRGATNPGHQGGARPAPGGRPAAGGRSGGLAGLVTSLLGNRSRRRGL
ncbi:hypothetical protein [Pseudonocardia abyssalis]|uniref:Uncharacterized protein n=1 Tax=Pseudonocardia abyssalis TaxID=2792008 RepID=A0ABS6UU99_9PSEU|nr:hypothetical protein [Pseudonocardia abyssalis]MBW0117514.1 hypothetical protein [Pseudonocardia abyssalis]MBW0135795.1 hypothetical protein [Pseudonocardia abyssalis]